MFERGLAYRKKSKVNWCPQCCTVLANEQVIDGCCWRHEDTIVEQRDLEQWFLRTTNYAQELLDGLDKLARLAGKSAHHAAQLDRAQRRRDQSSLSSTSKTRTEARPMANIRRVHAGTAVLPARDDAKPAGKQDRGLHHPHGHHLRRHQHAACAGASAGQGIRPGRRNDSAEEVAALVEQQKKAREAGDLGAIEKHGAFTGHYAINPFSGERVPIWVANYILLDYGTGAIMSVPAHDERDYEFAKKYGLEMRIVILAAPDI